MQFSCPNVGPLHHAVAVKNFHAERCRRRRRRPFASSSSLEAEDFLIMAAQEQQPPQPTSPTNEHCGFSWGVKRSEALAQLHA